LELDCRHHDIQTSDILGNDTQHNGINGASYLNCYAECHYVSLRYAECRFTLCKTIGVCTESRRHISVYTNSKDKATQVELLCALPENIRQGCIGLPGANTPA
jgi:hypothetical protein